MSVRCAVFKEEVQAAILDGREIDVSFDNFPYYLRYISPTYIIDLWQWSRSIRDPMNACGVFAFSLIYECVMHFHVIN